VRPVHTPSSPAAHAWWTDPGGAGVAHVMFAVEGMRCAACARAVERAVRRVSGVRQVGVNVATGRALVDWECERTPLRTILAAVSAAGFTPVPLAGEASASAQRAERRTLLKRVGIAGLGMMQTMMIVDGLYAPGAHGIDAHIELYLRVAGMLVATPVFLYCGAPFLRGAWRDLRRRALGMDVPVALALLLAYGASVINTLRGGGETYFDSVTMFIFFLLAGRFIEMSVRHRSLDSAEALARSQPATVTRVRVDGSSERVAVQSIARGDRLLIPRGAVVPVDAELASDAAVVDESLVTGESAATHKHRGARLLGGSVNSGQPIEIVAVAPAADSTLSSIVALLERARLQRPAAVRAADRIASWFVLATLLLAAGVALVWAAHDPTRAFAAALAVLVVTCPCALSLAQPAATAAGTTHLARCGILVARADALERLAQVDAVVIDKTGTLTTRSTRAEVHALLEGFAEAKVLAIAAALERACDHPLAAAFAEFADSSIAAASPQEFPGRGVQGTIGGTRWRLGRLEFVAELATRGAAKPEPLGSAAPGDRMGGALYLGTAAGIIAQFGIDQTLRAGTREGVRELKLLGIDVVVASGDEEDAVQAVARTLGIAAGPARLDPTQKLAFVQARQAAGARVLMVGDGINDGPVLAAAHVSCAMGDGSAIAHAASDLLLLNPSLTAVAEAIRTARLATRITRQNLAWALLYNLTAVPLAALAWVPPWMAALGMSMSSLIVVLNAARLARSPRGAAAAAWAAPAGMVEARSIAP